MRWFLSIWLVSIALVCAALGGLALYPSPVVPPNLVLPQVPVVVIGSSLLRNGVPVSSSAEDSLLGDGRPHIRLSVSSIDEIEALDLARLAIASGSKTILMEIFPFCREFANKVAFDPQKERYPIAWAHTTLLQSRALLKTFNRRILGHSARRNNAAVFLQAPNFVVGPVREKYDLADLYPMYLHQPSEAAQLAKVVALAKSKGVDIYFLAPPTSEFAAEFQGDDAMAIQIVHAQAVADRFGVELISFGPVWPDTYFIDQGHLNLAGQQRLVQDLRAKWAVRHGN
jgi:hypothetical protein